MNTPIQKLALTISPPRRDCYNRFKNPNRFLYLDDKIQIQSILKYNKIGGFILYPELDSKGRLHYHGIIRLDSNEKVRFHKHAIHKLRQIGFVDIKPLKTFEDNLRWSLYMKKEWGFTQTVLEIVDPLMKEKRTLKVSGSPNTLALNDELDRGIMKYLTKELK